MRIFFLTFFLCPTLLWAQFTVEPLPKTKAVGKVRSTVRSQSENPLPLPFWDDFSFTDTSPNDSLWIDSENVRINADVGIDPPSINVASFDGLTATGEAYSANPGDEGPTDVLTSCPIALEGLSIGNNVYLSFFYQYGGSGENPEQSQGDSLILEFLSVGTDTTVWKQVWPLENDIVNRNGDFEQHILRLNDETYFSDEFQFRFRTFGRQSGLWDTWHVDYIYLNDNRDEGDVFYPDRNITSRLSAPFAPYTSVPSHFFSTETIQRSQFVRINLSDSLTAVSVNIETNVRSYLNGVETIFPLETIVDPISPTSFPGISDTITTEEVILDDTYFQNPFDSMFLNYRLIYNSGDTIEADFDSIDFRINDITSTSFILKDNYAYDDGSAEFGAGFSNTGNQLAYQFTLPEGESDSITAIDIHFPYIGFDPTGRSIALTIWGDNNGEPGNRLFQQNVTAIRADSINKFIRYELSRPIEVSGTFYVGYRQRFEGKFRVGLDRNTNSIDKVFTNTSGFWEPPNIIRGSLMIRPVFGVFTGVINSISDDLSQDLAPYPNPTNGIIKI